MTDQELIEQIAGFTLGDYGTRFEIGEGNAKYLIDLIRQYDHAKVREAVAKNSTQYSSATGIMRHQNEVFRAIDNYYGVSDDNA